MSPTRLPFPKRRGARLATGIALASAFAIAGCTVSGTPGAAPGAPAATAGPTTSPPREPRATATARPTGTAAGTPRRATATPRVSGTATARARRAGTYPFTITWPRQWTPPQEGPGDARSGGRQVASYSSSDTQRPRGAIQVIFIPRNESGRIDLNVVAAEAEQSVQRSGARDFRTELQKSVTVGRLSGQERLYAYTLNGASLQQRTVYLLGERYLYGLTLAAPAAEMATFDPTFTAVLDSFSET